MSFIALLSSSNLLGRVIIVTMWNLASGLLVAFVTGTAFSTGTFPVTSEARFPALRPPIPASPPVITCGAMMNPPYALSIPCSSLSRPITSSSRLARSPWNFLIRLNTIIIQTVVHKTIENSPKVWIPRCLKPPP